MKNIKSDFTNYSNIIEKVGEERISERLYALYNLYKKFCTQMGYNDGKDIFMNGRILTHAILDYFTDITRLKNFHNIKLINQDKIIAYESSWILRRKPIQILNTKNENVIFINEKFVFTILINHLTRRKIDDLSDFPILKSFCDILLYYLKFRDCSPKILEMMISSFKAGNSIDRINYD